MGGFQNRFFFEIFVFPFFFKLLYEQKKEDELGRNLEFRPFLTILWRFTCPQVP